MILKQYFSCGAVVIFYTVQGSANVWVIVDLIIKYEHSNESCSVVCRCFFPSFRKKIGKIMYFFTVSSQPLLEVNLRRSDQQLLTHAPLFQVHLTPSKFPFEKK